MTTSEEAGTQGIDASFAATATIGKTGIDKAPKVRPGAMRALAGGCWGTFFGSAAVFTIPFGVFLKPIMADTGWSRETVSGGLGIAVAFIALCSPLAGRLTDMIGVRRFSILSFPAFGIGLITLGLASHSAAMFLLAAALLGVLSSGQTAVSYSKLIVGWFDKSRGFAFGTMLALSGLGTAVSPPLSAFLIGHMGWRYTYVSLGVFIFLLGTVGAWLMVYDPPSRTPSDEVFDGVDVKVALRTRSFWILTISLIAAVVAIAGAPAVIPSILVDRGHSPLDASLVVSAFGISIVVARLFVGFLLDHFWAPFVTIAALICPAIGLVILSISQSYQIAILSAILLGVGFGSEMDVLGYMLSRAFGQRHFGQIFGVTFAFFAAANGAGPIGLAMALNRFGISTALLSAAGLIAVSVCLLLILGEEDFTYGNRPGKRWSQRRSANGG